MKKTLLFNLLIVCASFRAFAQQPLDYQFSQELQGFYTPLQNDVTLYASSFDDVISPAVTIPAFIMGGVQYTTMYVNANGFISLGLASNTNTYSPLTSSVQAPIISPFGLDLQSVDATSRISYSIDNSGVHVQWQNVRRFGVNGESFSFQAHLLPSDSMITFVYGPMNNISPTISFAQVGLRVGSGSFPLQLANRSVTTTQTWFPSAAGTSYQSNCAFSSAIRPFNGLTYVWGSSSIGVGGCTDVMACNFNSAAVFNDGTCEYCSCQTCGCMDSTACNFDMNATYNVACNFSCYGCTDSTATNFDPSATNSDGSCFYAGPGETCSDPFMLECGEVYSGNTMGIVNDNAVSGVISCLSNLGSAGQHWYIFTAEISSVVQLSTMGANTSFDTQIHVFSGVNTSACGGALNCVASNDDFGGTLQSQITFTTQPGLVYYVRIGGYASQSGVYELNASGLCQLGCTDTEACNYDSSAVSDDGTCEYCSCNSSCGCTDSAACNFNSQATIDDGSCYSAVPVDIGPDFAVCQGETVILGAFIAIDNASFNWTFGGAALSSDSILIVQATQTGIYEITVTDANGCSGSDYMLLYVNNCVAGCMDSTACDFNAQANAPVNCDYSCLGCTDPEALNYEESATIDNGSCYFVGEGTTCANPINLSCSEGWYSGVTVGVVNDNTTSGSNVCGGVSSSGQRWYVYQPSFSSTVTVSTINSLTNYDTYLKVFTGSCGNLSCVGFNDDIPGTNFQSQVIFQAQAGTTYFIRVGGFASQQGTFGLTFECGGGCLDPQACNYEANAPFDDGSCTYGQDCYGCTDENAANYEPQAVYSENCEYTTVIYVYHDTNGDGIRQQNEPGMSNWAVSIPGLNATIFTNNSGIATLNVAPNSYTIELINNSSDWISSSATALTINIPNAVSAAFGLIPATGEAFYAAGPYDGFWDIIHCEDGYEAGVFLNNLGTVDLSGTLTLTCNSMFTPEQDVYSSIAPDQVAAGFAQWNINAFPAGSNGIFSFHIGGPGPVNIGTTYNFNFHLVLNDAQGNVIYDNTWITSPFIACSYDPNDLTATPEGYEAPHFVLAGDRMQYRVRFQNTGNLPAEDVRIAGALDPTKFDLSTFSPLYGSAPFVTCLLDDGTIDFTFNDIYLPDATNNEPESHGFVVYEVSLLPGISPNEVVLNQASIYFDSNPAIITNETFHTIFDCTSFTSVNDASVCEGELVELNAQQPYVSAYTWIIDGNLENTNTSEVTLNLSAGTHSVQLTTANPLCGENHNATIVVNSTPELILPATNEVCQYSTIQLLAEGNGTIIWSNGVDNGSPYDVNGSQTLVAYITSEEGCTTQAEWNIEAFPLPSAQTLVVGQEIIALDGDAWQWFLNGEAIEGASSNSYTMMQEGTYSVEVMSINGCSNMSDFTYYVLGIEEASSLGIIVYPNPMESELRIDLPEQGFYSIELRDMTGRLVVSRAQCQTTCTLRREGNAAGIYELLIKGEGVMAHQRVLLK